MPRLREEFRWVQELPVTWTRDLDHYLITHRPVHGRAAWRPRTFAEVWRFVLAVNEHGADYFLPNIAISITHSTALPPAASPAEDGRRAGGGRFTV